MVLGYETQYLGFYPLPRPFPGPSHSGSYEGVNTDYHHGDCPLGSFWCGVQMKAGDLDHPVVGRIRAWDALIILFRRPVSSLLFISHLPFSPLHLFSFLAD